VTRALRRWGLLVLLAATLPVALAPRHAFAQESALDDIAEPDGEESAESEGDEAAQPEADETETDETNETDEADAPAEPESDAAEPPADGAEAGRALELYVGLGFGFGTVSFERPTDEGVQALDETPFAAAEVVLRARVWPEDRLWLEVLVAYHSSLGLRLQLSPLFALPQSVDARVERGELSVAPVMRLGGANSAFALALPIGFAFQSLVSELHQFDMPQYIVGGPQLRAELLVELGELVELRVGPEAQWIMLIGSTLREQEACCSGVAFGGQAALEARFGPHVGVALAYRQLQSIVPAPGVQFKDVERFLTARIAGGF
jgi:hypothetical protein